MTFPLEITSSRMEPSEALESRIRTLASGSRSSARTSCAVTVVVEAPGHHTHQGGLFNVHVDLTTPGEQIAIRRAHPHRTRTKTPTWLCAASAAFPVPPAQACRSRAKAAPGCEAHIEPLHGRICELEPDRHFGRIETDDGRLIYFHSHSVLDRKFDELTTGMAVRFAEEAGDSGPQASSVHVMA